MADLLSATATMPEQLTATAEQLTATAEQQTSTRSPQPYAPDKQGPADCFQKELKIIKRCLQHTFGMICK